MTRMGGDALPVGIVLMRVKEQTERELNEANNGSVSAVSPKRKLPIST